MKSGLHGKQTNCQFRPSLCQAPMNSKKSIVIDQAWLGWHQSNIAMWQCRPIYHWNPCLLGSFNEQKAISFRCTSANHVYTNKIFSHKFQRSHHIPQQLKMKALKPERKKKKNYSIRFCYTKMTKLILENTMHHQLYKYQLLSNTTMHVRIYIIGLLYTRTYFVLFSSYV